MSEESNEADFKRTCQTHNNCLATYEGRMVLIEYVYRGRGVHKGVYRAKIVDDTTIRYVGLTMLTLGR